jgi:hypothetical protein
MIQAVVLFLIVMVAMGVGGRLMRRPRVASRKKCPKCGRYRIGKGACDCGKAG